MRISELSAASGVPLPSIKYYLREDLLPAGTPTSANQASYGEDHVRRLKLIRALIDVGGLSVATAREVLQAIDADRMPLAQVFGIAQRAVSQSELFSSSDSAVGTARIDALVEHRGWAVSEGNPGRAAAANVVDACISTGHPELLALIDEYAAAAETVAAADLDAVARQPNVAAMAETVVAGTVLGDALFAGLRRIAQEHITSQRFPHSPPGTPAEPRAASSPRASRDSSDPAPHASR